MEKCSCQHRWEIGSRGPLCDFIEYYLGTHKKKSILVEFTEKYVNYNPHKKVEPSDEYSYFTFDYGQIMFRTNDFKYADSWTKSSYLVGMPLKKIEDKENRYDSYEEWWGSEVFLDQYSSVILRKIID